MTVFSIHIHSHQNGRASQMTLTSQFQNLCRIVDEQQRSAGEIDIGIISIKAGQDVEHLFLLNNGQLHVRGDGGKVDFSGISAASQNRENVGVDCDFFRANDSGSLIHRHFPPYLQNKKTRLGLMLRRAVNALPLTSFLVLLAAFAVAMLPKAE